jgi:YD repeat-containing protein
MNRIKFILIFSFCIYTIQTFSQVSYPDEIKKLSPLTPNAASLGKFGNTPVSLYTGVPNIQIPVYTINVKGFQLPISLSYHAGGIKVEEIASWVGLGWALNSGGVISRNQRGQQDEITIQRYNELPSNTNSYYTAVNAFLNPSATQGQKESITLGQSPQLNSEADIFNYSMGGLSGKFFMDMGGNCFTVPANKLKFVHDSPVTYTPVDELFYGRWTVKDNEGNTYVFGEASDDVTYNNSVFEITSNQAVCSNIPSPTDPNYTGDFNHQINTWYLREIILPSQEKIEFTYEAYTYCMPYAILNETNIFSPGNPLLNDHIQNSGATLYRRALRIQQITFPQGKVAFVKSAFQRQDVIADYPLDRIEIYQKQGATYSLLKYFKLGTNNPNTPNLTSDDLSFRLMLTSVTEYDKDNNPQTPYSMEYSASSHYLPPRDSKSQDLWGYYNGVANTIMIPAFIANDAAHSLLDGALRYVDPAYAASGTLSKITYPTGGYTTFEYESNQGKLISPMACNLMSAVIKGTPVTSVLRCESTNTTGTTTTAGNEVTITNFTYSTPARLDYTFYDPTLMNQYIYDSQHNNFSFINVIVQKKQTDGSWLEYPTAIFVTPNGNMVNLVNGTYRIQLTWSGSPSGGLVTLNKMATFALTANTYGNQSVDASTVLTTGGLRIKTITDYYNNNLSPTSTSYDYTDNGISSGIARSVPAYFYNENYPKTTGSPPNTLTIIYNGALFRTSVSQSPLLTSQGAPVGYSKVTAIRNGAISGQQNGTTENWFNSALDFPDDPIELDNTYIYPFTGTRVNDWMLGTTKKVIHNKQTNLTLQPLKKEEYSYTNYSTGSGFIDRPNIKAGFNSMSTSNGGIINTVWTGLYHTNNGYPFLSQKTTTDYENGIPNVTLQESYTINPNNYETATSTTGVSNGTSLVSYTLYAGDLYDPAATAGDALAIKNLVELYNKPGVPIEKYIVRVSGSNQSVINGTYFQYSAVVPNVLEVNSLNTTIPIPLAQFHPAHITSHQLVSDAQYYPVGGYVYNPTTFDILTQQKATGTKSSLIWGYSDTYPVASAVNAGNNNIFYDSFEEGDGNSSIGDAKTGHYSYIGSSAYSRNITGLDYVGNFILSYWLKSANGTWSFVSNAVPVAGNSYSIGPISGQIDDVRFYPANAQITTYTYDPLVGVTSRTDAKGEITFYEYDSFQRLKNIKDKEGNIVKHIDYHYQGQ